MARSTITCQSNGFSHAFHYSVTTVYGCSTALRWTRSGHENRRGKRAWQDSNLRHTAPETVALSPELQARERVGTAR
jgi:hypothetical protein